MIIVIMYNNIDNNNNNDNNGNGVLVTNSTKTNKLTVQNTENVLPRNVEY